MTLAEGLPALAAALALFFGLRDRPPGLRLGAAVFLGAAAAVLARYLPNEALRWGFVLAFALLARVLYPFPRRTGAPPPHIMDPPRLFWLFLTVLLLVLIDELVYGW
ncbi:MAG TPA: hypothetical protein ENJ85_05335 [Oceanithermus profundus]|uniref:Uncharacterized protein n=1 Tax=Oceanithermus profundus TaxID=187137 RepID=A0A7C5WWK6_9DEIN|nr:hypothetical protein [Oceanithermus profundus]